MEHTELGDGGRRITVLLEEDGAEIEAGGVVLGVQLHGTVELGFGVGHERSVAGGMSCLEFDPSELGERHFVPRMLVEDILVEGGRLLDLSLVLVGGRLGQRLLGLLRGREILATGRGLAGETVGREFG